MRTEPKSRILEAFSKFAETSRRGTGSAIGAPEQSSPSDHSFRPAGAPKLRCSAAVVIAEQAAQSLTTSHLPVGTADAFFRFEQRVLEPSMVALSVIMMDELSDGTAQRLLTEEDHPLQALALDRVLPPLSVGEITLRLYAALNYSQNSAHDLRRTINGAEALFLQRDTYTSPTANSASTTFFVERSASLVTPISAKPLCSVKNRSGVDCAF